MPYRLRNILKLADGLQDDSSPHPIAFDAQTAMGRDRPERSKEKTLSADEGDQGPGSPASAATCDPGDDGDIRRTLQGDGDAFARLIQRYEDEIGRYMWRFTRDRLQWEELVHEVFVQAFTSLRTYKRRAPLVHWLRRIATRVGYGWWRRRGDATVITSLASDDWANALAVEDTSLAAAEAGELVHLLLAKLSTRDRLVLTLVYLEGCPVAEAAELAGWSKTMTKVQLHRARGRLRKLLEERAET